MIGRRPPPIESEDTVAPKGFDDFSLRLGDIMRGERATLGKSLLDVQRELKIKASYIAAIENADPTAFESPGFIAGYVRSYARYLHLDPEWAFSSFCEESGFATAHGMSAAASSPRQSLSDKGLPRGDRDFFEDPNTPFVPVGESVLSRIEPGAVGSLVVLVALIAGIGYGGWTVLQEVQKVQLAPVEQTPTVVSEIDPLATGPALAEASAGAAPARVPNPDALDRLYRPPALDVPVLVARDAPISTIDPRTVGTFLPEPPALTAATDPEAQLPQGEAELPPPVQVFEPPVPEVVLFAVRPTWVRVRAADGSVLLEKILEPGEEYVVPSTEEPATLRAGNSGSLYFKVNGEPMGPAGPGTSTVRDVALSADAISGSYTLASPDTDQLLFELINVAQAPVDGALPQE